MFGSVFCFQISVSIYTISNTFILGLVAGNVVGYYAAQKSYIWRYKSMYGTSSIVHYISLYG
jgi:PST family polysaccharide transporter